MHSTLFTAIRTRQQTSYLHHIRGHETNKKNLTGIIGRLRLMAEEKRPRNITGKDGANGIFKQFFC